MGAQGSTGSLLKDLWGSAIPKGAFQSPAPLARPTARLLRAVARFVHRAEGAELCKGILAPYPKAFGDTAPSSRRQLPSRLAFRG